MHRLRHPVAQLAMVLSMVVWILGLGAEEVHEHAIVHVVCAEHGQVVELDGSVATQAQGDAITAPAKSLHSHGCDFVGGASDAAPSARVVVPSAVEVAIPERVAARLVTAPRPPPLGYAPKTSPPSLVA